MRLECLPRSIAIESPPLVEPGQALPVDDRRQKLLRAFEHVCGQSDIIQQHTLIVSNILHDNISHCAALIREILASLDQCRTFFDRQEVIDHEHLAWIQVFLGHGTTLRTSSTMMFPAHYRVFSMEGSRTLLLVAVH